MEIYACVFFFRLCSILPYQGYLPADSSGDWLYSVLEVLAFLMVLGVIYLIMFQYKSTYEMKYDAFGNLHVPEEAGIVYLVVPCMLLGMLFHPNLNQRWFADVAWTIALYLESVAILPQLYMFQKRGGGTVETCISQFVYALAFGSFLHLVRCLYLSFFG